MATGTVTGTYNKTSKLLTYSITYSGLTPTIGHFHYGAPGKTGGHVFTLSCNSSSKNNGTLDAYVSPIAATATLADDQATALLGQAMYVNLHTVAYPDGEIRADVMVK